MLQAIYIRDFQSLQKADFELGKFTVFVGSSSSGKSAVFRAVKAAVMNPRGLSNYVSHWAKKMSVTVETDKGSVRLSVAPSGTMYTVEANGKSDDFSKLNNVVPEQVSNALGIYKEDVELVFASQFDRPYMLDETGSKVAATLGALTNIDLIFTAVKESNRRKQASSSKLKVRETDRDVIQSKLGRLDSVKKKADACTELETRLAQAKLQQEKIVKLSSALRVYSQAKNTKDSLTVPTEPPSLDKLNQVHNRLSEFKTALRNVVSKKEMLGRAQYQVDIAEQSITSAEEELSAKLVELGICPLCKGVIHD